MNPLLRATLVPSQWMFTKSPGPLPGGIALHSPSNQWKIILAWSILGIALAVIPLFAKRAHARKRIGAVLLGSAFALVLWIFALQTKTVEVSANGVGLRMTSALGWRDVPWNSVHRAEDQDIFTTYYNGKMKMWELPFPGNTAHMVAFLDERGRTLMTLDPNLQPAAAFDRLLSLCTQVTGLRIEERTVAIPE